MRAHLRSARSLASALRRGLARVLHRRAAAERGEIADDEFARHIRRIASDPRVRTILEIGSATGAGSTASLVRGAQENPSRPTLFCIEPLPDRYAELARRYAEHAFVRCYNVSSVGPERFAHEEHVRSFYRITPTALNRFPLELVLAWRAGDIETVQRSGVEPNGIELIRRENAVDVFDAVLIDGSEFTARAELELVDGARFVLLDDIDSFKNHSNCQRLLDDERYALVAGNPRLRHGYAIFERRPGASR